MQSLYFDLRQVLEKQGNVVNSMVEATQEHNQALQNSDSVEILATVARLEELSQRLQGLDKEREKLQGHLARRHGLQGDVTLQQLWSHIKVPAVANDLDMLSAGLQKDLEQLAVVNQLNNMLAQRGLAFTKQLMRTINPGCDTYAGGGQLKTETNDRAVISIIDKTI
ncbi:MAG: flagellar protein FlgN [Peptococcaceae bacterium]|nr:flagellar protein FlgN [Candidatus Syntrophopropionicum ammoniitolerans]